MKATKHTAHILLFVLPLLLLPLQGKAQTLMTGGGSLLFALFTNLMSDNFGYVNEVFEVAYKFGLSVEDALPAVVAGTLDYVIMDRGYPPEVLESMNLIQMPIAASPVIITYNLGADTPPDNVSLVLSVPVLADIWRGNIILWNDARIQALNPNITLPAQAIVLIFGNDRRGSISDVFANALADYDPDFALSINSSESFASKWSTYGSIAGRGIPVSSGPEQIGYVQNIPYSMTYNIPAWCQYLGWPHIARMRNNAGVIVTADTDSVHSAIREVSNQLNPRHLAIDVKNGNLSTSWPIVMFSYITTQLNHSSSECNWVTYGQQMLAWSQLNAQLEQKTEELSYVPLPFYFKRQLMDTFGLVTCNGVQSYNNRVAIGNGQSFTVGSLWARAYPYDPNFSLAFYNTQSDISTVDEFEADNVDFGITSGNAPVTTANSMWVPISAYAIGVGYNVPEMPPTATISLNYTVLADIYLGTVDRWNHPAILELNPELASILPATNITVVVSYDTPHIIDMLTQLLSQASPIFNATVGVGSSVVFPVAATGRAMVVSGEPAVEVGDRPHSLTVSRQEPISVRRYLGFADFFTARGERLAASVESLAAVLRSQHTEPFTREIVGKGEHWPLVAYDSILVHEEYTNCDKARALIDFLYWSQTAPEAVAIANRNGIVLPTHPWVKAQLADLVTRVTCQGVAASSFAPCVYEGVVCSNHGNCSITGVCQCDDGYEGLSCEDLSTGSSGSDAIVLGAVLGSVIPVVLLLMLLICGVSFILWTALRRGEDKDEWEVDMNEFEMGEELGAGGYGTVHKALWKGTEVAVKTLNMKSTNKSTVKELERSFKDEVRVMTALRHPNVVLFMAACTKPPNMCIVMEFMSLGSLYDLLHNELVPEIPWTLRIKICYQAAKGMHFLHSSGIVHRDLKSLNLLLDSKWNIKVSDFGLTKYKEQLAGEQDRRHQVEGSIQWMAPEVLDESTDVDYMLADVYSFGIILWEVMTRHQPFEGLSPAATAVGVIRDQLRPPMPAVEADDATSADYRELIKNAWHQDPIIRPSFLEIMTRLSSMGADHGASSTSSSISFSGGGKRTGSHSFGDTTRSTSSASSSASGEHFGYTNPGCESSVRPPEGEVTIVFTDITRAASLWEFDALAMRDATIAHNNLLRALLKKHRGYEVAFLNDKASGEGSFCMAFSSTQDAIKWCVAVQLALMTEVEWPSAILNHPGAADEWDEVNNCLIYHGLRVRMGVHVGQPRQNRDPKTRRVEYIGPAVNAAARIATITHGGQIVLSDAARRALKKSDLEQERDLFVARGRCEMPDDPKGTRLFAVRIKGLEARLSDVGSTSSVEGDEQAAEEAEGEARTIAMKMSQDEGMVFKEDNFLTSANLCRWIINFKEVELTEQIGLGSCGVVYKGVWKGVQVAVKRFIRQQLDERRLLEFRAEMAFLSELQHPNIVLFIGACVRRPNLCIVTEYVRQGALKGILENQAIRIPWSRRLQMLKSTAVGLAYLHGREPAIVHRDLKPSNLLVDENWEIKVADFGFARIKEDNATMTRCGSPCWTAPEVIRGQRYSEKVDVYSFGIIIWQMLTRKTPYPDRNFMGVSMDVLEGRRPAIPPDCPSQLKKLMKRCWNGNASKRPSIEEVVDELSAYIMSIHHHDEHAV